MTTKQPPASPEHEAAHLVARSTVALLDQLGLGPSTELSVALTGIAAGSALHAGASLEWWLKVAAMQWERARKMSGL